MTGNFRQQVVGDDSVDWSKLNQSLYTVTFIAQGDCKRGRNCAICLESDHTEEQCALYSSASKSAAGRKEKPSSKIGSEGKELPSGRAKPPSKMACFAWNQSQCRYPACKYRHVCTQCGGDHKVYQCPWLREKDDRPSWENKPQGLHEGC